MIRVGIGGWTFAPWRGAFFPTGLPHASELGYAAGKLTSIEVNGTFYRTQSPDTFARWARETPDDFVFALKAPRFAVTRRQLGDAGDSIDRFFASGVDRLGDKLGPILWQFAPTRKFVRDDIAAFIKRLPAKLGERQLRHVIEPRHDSFADPAFAALLADANIAIAYADSDKYPTIGNPAGAATADFAYARLQRSRDDCATGYADDAIAKWAATARRWAKAGATDVFVYFISGAKVRNPAAATALIARLGRSR